LTERETEAGGAALSTDALTEWTHHVEAVMRGLAHALNNRAAALSAIIELSREPDDEPEVTRSILTGELGKVRELAKAVRSVGPPRDGADALSPNDLVAETLAVLQLHADIRDRVIQIDAADAPVVRVAPWMLLRALVLLCADAPVTDAASRTARVTLGQDGDWLVVRAEGTSGVPASPYLAALARRMGGDVIPGGFRIPTLESLRRREAR